MDGKTYQHRSAGINAPGRGVGVRALAATLRKHASRLAGCSLIALMIAGTNAHMAVAADAALQDKVQKTERVKAKPNAKSEAESGGKKAMPDKAASDKAASKTSALDEAVEEIAVSLRESDDAINLADFKLRDVNSSNTRPASTLNLRSSALLTTDGVMVGGLTGQTLASGGSFSLFDDPATGKPGLNISLLTRQERGGLIGISDFDRQTGLSALNNDVGISLGYAGFNFDASFSEYDNPAMLQQGFGIEAGLSFSTNSFSARLSARQYRDGSDLLGPNNVFRQFISYELGAQYRLGRGFGVTGGVRYSDFGAPFLNAAGVLGDKDQVVFVGGNLRF